VASGDAYQDLVAFEGAFQDLVASEGAFRDLVASGSAFRDLAASGSAFRDLAASEGAFQDLVAFVDAFQGQVAYQGLESRVCSCRGLVACQVALVHPILSPGHHHPEGIDWDLEVNQVSAVPCQVDSYLEAERDYIPFLVLVAAVALVAVDNLEHSCLPVLPLDHLMGLESLEARSSAGLPFDQTFGVDRHRTYPFEMGVQEALPVYYLTMAEKE